MENRLILKKDHLPALLRKWSREYRVIVPSKNIFGDTLFELLPTGHCIDIDLANRPVSSPKRFLLPQADRLFSYKTGRTGYTFTEYLQGEPTIIFGLRSCDTRGILFYDMIFQETTKDNYYLERRKNTMLVNLGCNTPQPNCFCKSARSGPFLSYGFDIQLTDLGDRFFVETGRPKGLELLKRWSYFFQEPAAADMEEQYETVLEAEGKFSHLLDFDAVVSEILNDRVDPAIWEELGKRCQNCGGCAFICPTCYCFNIIERPRSTMEGERLRVWDSCTFAGFTRVAGGHASCVTAAERIKRRFYHKLFYDKKKYNIPSCVGCGRCADICFGLVDMLGFMRRISESRLGKTSFEEPDHKGQL